MLGQVVSVVFILLIQHTGAVSLYGVLSLRLFIYTNACIFAFFWWNQCVLLSAIESHYASLKADIQDEAINKIVFNYASPSFGACLAGPDILLSLAQDNKKMQKIIVPKEKPKKVGYFGGVASETDVCFLLAIVPENLKMLC